MKSEPVSDTNVLAQQLEEIITQSHDMLPDGEEKKIDISDTPTDDLLTDNIDPTDTITNTISGVYAGISRHQSEETVLGSGIVGPSDFHADTLSKRKDLFVRYIQDQIQTLKIRINVLNFKYVRCKGWFEFYNISILVLSTALTFVEAMRTRFDVSTDDMESGAEITMGVIPIVISTLVTIASALVKFKRYQVKMENLQRAIQKSIFTTYRLKRIQENAKHLRSHEALEKLIQMYSGEPYDLYVQSQEEMEKNLRYEDLVTHMRTYYALSLEYQRNEMNYRIKRLQLGAKQQLRVENVEEEAANNQNRSSNKEYNGKHKSCCGWLFSQSTEEVVDENVYDTGAKNRQRPINISI
tara:strand:+ start:88 stop:1149 length:1062 start_codon:yes stop_codon:yes gene_type:complete